MPTFYKGAGMARDRPAPSGALELLLFIVARGPVPRDLSIKRTRRGTAPALRCLETFLLIVVRGPVPRDLSIKRTRRGTGPRPTVHGAAPHEP